MALNKILQGMVQDFRSKYFLDGDDSKVFEHLANYITVSKFHPEAFCDAGDFESLIVDKKGLFGIDGIAFVVNGNLVVSKNDIADYAKSNYLDVHILIMQAKIEEKCDTGDLLKTINAAKSFMGDRELLRESNTELENAYDIYDEIFRHSKYFSSSSPQCHINYVTAAQTWDKAFVEKLCSDNEREIHSMFSEIKQIDIRVLGCNDVVDTYSELENSIDIEVNFRNNLSFDKISQIEQSYLGYLSGDEYLKIITDKNGDIRTRVFYENVRDYQGESNPVNKEIRHTLKTPELRDKFVLLNNGITIVTKHFKSLGSNIYELRGFQVVNGCQTSHEIYNARSFVEEILVPVKIIHTTDSDVISMIVKSTNRQTPVPTEAFVALESYHKHLQQAFEEHSKEMPLAVFYERRSGELALRKKPDKHFEIATLHSIIRSVTSVYFQEPYIVYNSNPANILKDRYNKLFQTDHPYEIYYLSYYLFANYLALASENVISRFAYKFRFYTIMVARCILANNAICGALNSKETRNETTRIIDICKNNPAQLRTAILKAKEDVISVYKSNIKNKCDKDKNKILKTLRSRDFCGAVLEKVKEEIE